MKRLMLGNEAVARGLYEACCRVVSSYPGTPSTEITEHAAEYKELYAEWAPNEKVALEVALGASLAGARAFCGMKHVGLNVAADPLFTASYTGVNGGLVVGVADDQGMHSSQNEQDSRHYAVAAKLPMLEPSDSNQCRDYTKFAFDLSEKFDTPVMLRLSTRISHSQGIVEELERADLPLKDYIKDPAKYVMIPSNARGRHVAVEKRQADLRAYAEECPLNRIEKGDPKIGVITAGIAYQYAKEALPNASYLKLGLVNPLPQQLIADFAASVEKLYVIEELDGVIEDQIKAMGIAVTSKALFSNIGEYSQAIIKEKLLGEKPACDELEEQLPARPPVLCPGCPHRSVFYILGKLKLNVFGDIGCYTLGAAPPLNAMDTCVCMGAAVSMLHGFNKARELEGAAARSVGVIGDSTFMHSGITGLIDITYNQGLSTVIVLDNSTTGMTGHQENPATGKTLQRQMVAKVSIEKVCQAVGVKRVRVVDPNDMALFEKTLKEELAANEPSVIITRSPCVLLKGVAHGAPLTVNQDACTKCKSCLKIGCPAISWEEGAVKLDQTICVGCGQCQSICPFGAIDN